MSRPRYHILLLALLPGLAGCGDGPAGPSGVTAAEARELVRVLALLDSFHPARDSWSCPLGGTVRGQYRTRMAARSLVYSSTLAYEGCRARDTLDVLTLDGELNGEVVYGFDDLGRVVSADGVHTGSLEWRRGVRTGSCDLDLASEPSPDDDTLILSGTVCSLAVTVRVPGD